jgi:hypothetical protein
VKWHCGILGDPTVPRPTWRLDGIFGWRNEGAVGVRQHELAVWLAMPGFSTNYHASNLKLAWNTVRKYQQLLRGFDELSADVAANWLSVTRDDAVQLCRRRPEKGDVPIICQLRMLDDLKAGRRHATVAREYGVRREWLSRVQQKGLRAARCRLPAGFELLVRH